RTRWRRRISLNACSSSLFGGRHYSPFRAVLVPWSLAGQRESWLQMLSDQLRGERVPPHVPVRISATKKTQFTEGMQQYLTDQMRQRIGSYRSLSCRTGRLRKISASSRHLNRGTTGAASSI